MTTERTALSMRSYKFLLVLLIILITMQFLYLVGFFPASHLLFSALLFIPGSFLSVARSVNYPVLLGESRFQKGFSNKHISTITVNAFSGSLLVAVFSGLASQFLAEKIGFL